MSETGISNLWGEITVLVVICCFALPAHSKYGGGSGIPEDPYQIWDANHMQAIGADANDWDKCFKLMADIDLSDFKGTSFNIIGTDANHLFSGVFDGNYHMIANFTYDSNDKSPIGLFGVVRNAEIKDLRLLEPNVNAGMGAHVGSLIGHYGGITLTDCYAEGGRITGYGGVGGLVGCCYGYSKISNCYSSSNVAGTSRIGGLIGFVFIGSPIISNCYATGSVDGNDCVGGLVGWNIQTVINCYATGRINGNDYVGGLVGANGGTISNCYSTGEVSGSRDVGGLVGGNDGSVTNCYSAVNVRGDHVVGGLVGFNDGGVSNCFWDIEIQTYGVTDSIGRDELITENVAGLQTAQMQARSIFTDAGWDFINNWNMGENQTYPYIRTVLASDINEDHTTNLLDLCILAARSG